jgi:nitroreductase
METWNAIKTIRVVRRFRSRALDEEHLQRILHAGRRAGSSKNQQRWAFVVVRDRQHLRELSKVGDFASHLAGAAAAVALVTPEATGHARDSIMWDCGRAAQNMVLAAWELAVGSVPATVYDHALAARLLDLPPGRRCDFLLSFGYPEDESKLKEPNKAGGRFSLEEIVHEERW